MQRPDGTAPASLLQRFARFTFTGKEYDPASGLYYYNARWYDPELGRFVSEDTYAGDP
ncbi:MAG: hypothetical protein IMW99_11245 [Firmicutes bacterium]|nr:hypothetical protein [Bacillota bacterium]